MPMEAVTAESDVSQSSQSASSDAGFDRGALEAKVAKGLASIGSFDSDPSDPPVETPDVQDPPVERVQDDPAPDAQPDLNEPTDEQNQQPEKPEAKPEVKAPTIPAAYRRSLKAYDWTDEEIDAAYSANPGTFLVTAQKIHTNRNAEVSKWAEAGRATRPQPDAESNQTATEAVGSKHVDPKTGSFRPLDVDAMVEKYGNEDMVREIAEPVNQIITQINAMLPDLMHGVNTIKRTRQETLARQIDDFFGSEEVKPYADIYGKDHASLNDEQRKSRDAVLELADALVAGARQQGRNLSVSEALTFAHDMNSSKHNKDKIRTEIRGKVVERNKGLTLRPSHTSGKPEGGPPSGKQDLENRTRARLAKVFG